MRILLAGLALLVFLALMPAATAQVACADAGTCLGNAYTRVCNQTLGCGVTGGTRDFCLTTRADCVIQDGTTWELDAGSSVTITYRTTAGGVAPPPTADTVVLDVLFDNTGTVIRTLHNGAPPANGATFTFHATDTGAAGGVASAGTYRLRVDVNAGGIGGYNANSDGSDANNEDWARGAVRSRLHVTTAVASTPPSGALFAFGTAANEQVTLTATHTQPNGDADLETARWRTRDTPIGTIRDTQASTDVDGTSSAFASTIDLTYQATDAQYDAEWDLTGNAALTGRTWTILTGTSAGRISDTTLRISQAFRADPRITFSTDGVSFNNDATTDHDVYNRAETVAYSFRLLNARGDQLTRTMSIEVLSAANGVEDSQSLTGPLYSSTYLIDAADAALLNEVGDLHSFRATTTDQSQESVQTFGVSRLYHVDSHPQVDSTLMPDAYPNQDDEETFQFIISADVVYHFCHVSGVRRDRDIAGTGNPALLEIIDPGETVADSTGKNLGVDGWTTSSQSFSAAAPAGVWKSRCSLTLDGNTGSDTELLGFTSAFTANLRTRLILDQAPAPGSTVTIYLRAERDEMPIAPGAVPTITVSYIQAGAWTNLVTADNMTNAVDWTETVNGSLYAYNLTFPDTGVGRLFNVNTLAFIRGAGIRNSEIINTQTLEVDILTSGLELGDTSTLNVLVLGTIVFLGIMLWARGMDLVVQVLGSILVWVGFLVALEFRNAWEPMIYIALVLGATAAYLTARTFLDRFNADREATPE